MITINEIVATVAVGFNLAPAALYSLDQTRELSTARHVAMHLARTHTDGNTTEIGRHFGKADHTAVLYATERVEHLKANDKNFARLVDVLSQAVEFKSHVARTPIDVLGLARSIYVSPRRQGIAVNLHEILALATTVIDLWDIALTAEAAIEAATAEPIDNEADAIAQDDLAAALLHAFGDAMAEIRGAKPADNQEEDHDGRSDS